MNLTDEQNLEFDSENLKQFAKAYLDYLHSTPLFTTKKKYKFFPPAAKPSEHDVLFGKNREESYKKLMDLFNLCILYKEFDKFFEGTKHHFWRSKTIPEIVIFKKWLLEVWNGNN